MTKSLIVVFLAGALALFGAPAFAHADDEAVLTIRSVSVAGGAVGVPLDVTIDAYFSNNVAADHVFSGNQACFSMVDEDGAVIALSVGRAWEGGSPDPDNPDTANARCHLYVTPVEGLAQGTLYTLTIHAGVRSNGGHVLPSDVVISFTTEGEKPVAPDPSPGPGDGSGEGAGNGAGENAGDGLAGGSDDGFDAGAGAGSSLGEGVGSGADLASTSLSEAASADAQPRIEGGAAAGRSVYVIGTAPGGGASGQGETELSLERDAPTWPALAIIAAVLFAAGWLRSAGAFRRDHADARKKR